MTFDLFGYVLCNANNIYVANELIEILQKAKVEINW